MLASGAPSLAADPSLAALKGARAGAAFGVPLYRPRSGGGLEGDNRTALWVDAAGARGGRETVVASVETTHAAGTYGAGEEVFFFVGFSDEVG